MTNIDLLGSDLEKKVRETSAQCELEWKKTGKAGFFKWRIENFKVVEDKNKNVFYSGDSYICLNSIDTGKTMIHNIHFWQGQHSSQDELGVSAYKAQELDTFLGTTPIQHREVQGHESQLFLSYFKDDGKDGTGCFTVLEGGVDSGFNKVEPTKYRPRLLHVKGTNKTMTVREVPIAAASVNSGDVFVLDLGTTLIQFQGKECSGVERAKAAAIIRAIDDQRGSNIEIVTFAEDDKDIPAQWTKLVGPGPYKSSIAGGCDKKQTDGKVLFRVSDNSGSIQFTKIAEGADVKRSLVTSDDCFIFYTGFELFCFVGLKSSTLERNSVFQIALKFMKDNNIPNYIPIHRMMEGGENEIFEEAFL